MIKKNLIVGVTSGLGNEILKNLDKNKYEVSITGRINKNNFPKKNFFKVDFLKKNQIKNFISKISKKRFDIVIHCLGGSFGVIGTNQSSKNYEKLFKLNFLYMVDVNKAILPIMKKKGWGRIVHISSASSYNLSGGPAYSSAKSAVNAYVQAMSLEFGKYGIIMTCICPGPIALKNRYLTNQQELNTIWWKKFKKNHIPMGRLSNPIEVVNIINFLITDEVSYCSGAVWNLDALQR